ncbi:MAG: Holliday junction resolvase RuvX [Prevotellaceae bacterium]|jgi:putative Holliday junction resolvase|nr:Holliday junction resolvase RuvX [Prevotellaceae bacterium]
MGRVLSVDYGRKRVGLAVTDPLKIIANALDAVHPDRAVDYIEKYMQREDVDTIVVGLSKNLDNSDTELMQFVRPFVKKLEKFNLPIVWVDERFTSKMAAHAMVAAGIKKSDRRKKENTDKVSAVIILQSYLDSIVNK